MIEITLTTIAAYGSFLAAEQFELSGVIATVAAGMLCGNYAARTGMSPSTRIAAETFWEYIAFALNSIVFLLVGLRVHIGELAQSWQLILAAYAAVTLARAAVVFGVSALNRAKAERHVAGVVECRAHLGRPARRSFDGARAGAAGRARPARSAHHRDLRSGAALDPSAGIDHGSLARGNSAWCASPARPGRSTS